MIKDIDIQNRVVNMHDVDTGIDEVEIIKYLDKKMKIRFHSVFFSSNSNYTYTGTQDDQSSNSITVSGYVNKKPNKAVLIG